MNPEIALIPLLEPVPATERLLLMDDHPALKRRSDLVSVFQTPALVALVKEMREIVLRRGAWGLAAIQLGVPLRVIVVRDVDGDLHLTTMVNPVLLRTLNREAIDREGCLSVSPSRWRAVSRPAKCVVEWQDERGNTHEADFRGNNARVVQHEIDHLEGILITDKPLP